jgi:hypothetical protein
MVPVNTTARRVTGVQSKVVGASDRIGSLGYEVRSEGWHTSTEPPLQRETKVRMPPLCQDLRIWANGGFRRTPARLSRFAREFDDLSEGNDKVPAALKRFELPGDKELVRAIDRDKLSVDRTIRHDLWVGRERLLSVLGLGGRTASS